MKAIIQAMKVTIIIIMLTNDFNMQNVKACCYTNNEKLPISCVNTDKKVVAIACNVYEGEKLLPVMLDVLERYNVKISFFFGGVWVKRNPGTLMLIKEKGHDIQNHGYNHRLPTRLDNEKNTKEIKDTELLIQGITGFRTTLFEPPSGDYDAKTLSLMDPLGYRMVTWSIDTIDWREDATKELILSRIAKKLKPGAIILMHPKMVTSESLDSIIQYVKNQGYNIITVSDILKYE